MRDTEARGASKSSTTTHHHAIRCTELRCRCKLHEMPNILMHRRLEIRTLHQFTTHTVDTSRVRRHLGYIYLRWRRHQTRRTSPETGNASETEIVKSMLTTRRNYGFLYDLCRQTSLFFRWIAQAFAKNRLPIKLIAQVFGNPYISKLLWRIPLRHTRGSVKTIRSPKLQPTTRTSYPSPQANNYLLHCFLLIKNTLFPLLTRPTHPILSFLKCERIPSVHHR